MDIIGTAFRNSGSKKFKVHTIPKSEWVSQKDIDGMREEMRARIDSNTAYRNRSARAAQNITTR